MLAVLWLSLLAQWAAAAVAPRAESPEASRAKETAPVLLPPDNPLPAVTEVISPFPSGKAAEIVIAPDEPVTIWTFEPAIIYEVPSWSFVSDPDNAGADTVPENIDPVRVATIESFIESVVPDKSKPVLAV